MECAAWALGVDDYLCEENDNVRAKYRHNGPGTEDEQLMLKLEFGRELL